MEVVKHARHEKESEAHRVCSLSPSNHWPYELIFSVQLFRQSAGHKPKGPLGSLPQTVNPDEETVPGIEHPGSTGVIYCSDRAMANGFSYASSHEWANLGQGAPEVGPIPDAPERPSSVLVPEDSLEYAPTTGVKGTSRSHCIYIISAHHECVLTPIYLCRNGNSTARGGGEPL